MVESADTVQADHRSSIRDGRQAFEGATDAAPPVMRLHSELGPERPGEGAVLRSLPGGRVLSAQRNNWRGLDTS